MSYILDALRQSEHDRQMATGPILGTSSTVKIRREEKSRLIPALLILTSLIIFSLIWWAWSKQLLSNGINALNNPTFTGAAQSQPMSTETLPEYIVQEVDLTHGHSSTIGGNAPETRTHTPAHNSAHNAATKNAGRNLSEHAEAVPARTAASIATAKVDPLDIPAMNIAGYVHEEQGGSIAMINNQLVHEGEEVSPGLRLVKILDDSAIFSYKGYVFSR